MVFGEEPKSNACLCAQVARSVLVLLRRSRARATSTLHEDDAPPLNFRQIEVHGGGKLATKSAVAAFIFLLFIR